MVRSVNAPRVSATLVVLASVAALAAMDAAPVATPAAASVAAKHVLPFIADDYTRAVAEARARKVPLFIEAWAPW
jgi:hypothetical protein